MKPLAPQHRKQLERIVADARDVAEQGARAAIEALAVHRQQPYAHMDEPQLHLRRRLRAHARQLGDGRDGTGTQAIEYLAQECAYEHWHGMLFARFLAENDLLIEPEMGVAVTLDECEELATGKNMDKWRLAAHFARAMLPQVFRPDLPVFEVRLAREHHQDLEALVTGLPPEVFAASDALGWLYQFWQSRKKADVNRSETKIGADELPAVTQLFTEPYMVAVSLGQLAGRVVGASVPGTAVSAWQPRPAAFDGRRCRPLRRMAGRSCRAEGAGSLLRLRALPCRRSLESGANAHGA